MSPNKACMSPARRLGRSLRSRPINAELGKEKLMATLEKAIEIAVKAHSGQVDKAGSPYILHPLRVMLRLSTNEQRIVGVLHDVVEDTEVTLEQLKKEGFSSSVLTSLDALTKRDGESRMQAAVRAAKDPIALVVKLADNAENMDMSRLPNPTEKDYQRLDEYKQVREYLLAAKNA